MAHPGGVHGEVQLAGARFGLDDAVEVLQEVDQVVGLLVEGHLAALDMAHVQDVVDEAEEVGAGGLDLAQVLLNPFGLIDAAGGQSGKAHDGVHGRADVVGHVGEEGALGGIRLVGLGEGLFQKGPLLHLFAGLDIDAAQAEDDVVSHAPIAVAHDGGLVVLGVLAAADAVVHVDARSVGQRVEKVLHRKGFAQHGLVLLDDGLVDVAAEAAVEGQIAREERIQLEEPVAADTQRLALLGVQVERANEQVVLGERLDEVALTAILAHLLLLLVRIVEQVALQEQLAVALDELHVAHDVHDAAVVVAHPILGAHRVADVLEGGDGLAHFRGIFGND